MQMPLVRLAYHGEKSPGKEGSEMKRSSKFICNLLNAAINKSKAKCSPWPPNDRIYVDLSHIGWLAGWTEPIKGTRSEEGRPCQDIESH